MYTVDCESSCTYSFNTVQSSIYHLNLKTKTEPTSEILWFCIKNYDGAQCINKYAIILNTYCNEDKEQV